MGVKCYVAGKFEETDRVQEVQDVLKAVGHTITHDWTRSPRGLSKRAQALLDTRGVLDADILVIIFEKDLGYKGAYTELGVALALGKPVYILGEYGKSNVFVHHPNVRRGEDAFNRDLIVGFMS